MSPNPAKPEPTLPETKEVSINARIPVKPNRMEPLIGQKPEEATEFPCAAVLIYSDGRRIVLPIRQPKASSASGKINAWGGGKIALEDNTQVQVGINLTILD